MKILLPEIMRHVVRCRFGRVLSIAQDQAYLGNELIDKANNGESVQETVEQLLHTIEELNEELTQGELSRVWSVMHSVTPELFEALTMNKAELKDEEGDTYTKFDAKRIYVDLPNYPYDTIEEEVGIMMMQEIVNEASARESEGEDTE